MATSRVMLDGCSHIKACRVMHGIKTAQVALSSGAETPREMSAAEAGHSPLERKNCLARDGATWVSGGAVRVAAPAG